MMNKPLVSVLMPVYNGIETIDYAIKSLKLQTYTNWKLIIVDDGSTDGTGEYLDALQKEGNRFKVIHLEKNKGRGFARNVCLQNAEGTYIAFLDADDMYMPEKLEKQVAFLEANSEISLVGCGVGIMDKNGEVNSRRPNSRHGEVIEYKEFDKVLFLHATVLIRLIIAENCEYKSYLKAIEDEDYFRQYLIFGKKYSKLEEILYIYTEFQSLTKSKLIYYGYNSLLYYGRFIFINKIAFKYFFITFIKLLIKTSILIFIKPSQIVNNRNIQIENWKSSEIKFSLMQIKS